MDRDRIKNGLPLKKRMGPALAKWKAEQDALKKLLESEKAQLAIAEKASPYSAGRVATLRASIKEVKALLKEGERTISSLKARLSS